MTEEATQEPVEVDRVEVIERAVAELAKEAERMEELRASEGAQRAAAFWRSLAAEWSGELEAHDVDSLEVERAAAAASAYLEFHR